jgi:hypothetical protein
VATAAGDGAVLWPSVGEDDDDGVVAAAAAAGTDGSSTGATGASATST